MGVSERGAIIAGNGGEEHTTTSKAEVGLRDTDVSIADFEFNSTFLVSTNFERAARTMASAYKAQCFECNERSIGDALEFKCR
jgi:hypothetical protein